MCEVNKLTIDHTMYDGMYMQSLINNGSTTMFFLQAYKQGFHGKKIVWITYMTTSNVFLGDSGCNKIQFDIVSTGMFVLNFLYYRTDNKKTISNLVRFFYLCTVLFSSFYLLFYSFQISFYETYLANNCFLKRFLYSKSFPSIS